VLTVLAVAKIGIRCELATELTDSIADSFSHWTPSVRLTASS
jgi:hypothetical protein